jgi:hypothetical protein
MNSQDHGSPFAQLCAFQTVSVQLVKISGAPFALAPFPGAELGDGVAQPYKFQLTRDANFQ